MQDKPRIAQGTGLADGRLVDLGSRRSLLWSDASGTMELEFLNTGMAAILQNLMGSNATLTKMGSGPAYQLACSLAAQDGQNFLSMQSLVPDTSGAINPQNFHGCKLTSAEFTIDTQNPLMVTCDVDAQQWEKATVAASPTYSTASRNFTFAGMTFAAGVFGSESPIDGVKKLTMKIDRTVGKERIYLGDANKAEPLTTGLIKVTGTVDIDLLPSNRPLLWDIYATQAAVPSISATFNGAVIGGSATHDSLKLNATDVFIDQNGTPELDNPEVVTATLNFTGLIDANNDSAFLATLTTGDTTF